MQAVIKQAIDPATNALNAMPLMLFTLFLFFIMEFKRDTWIPIELGFAKPQIAYVAMILFLGDRFIFPISEKATNSLTNVLMPINWKKTGAFEKESELLSCV